MSLNDFLLSQNINRVTDSSFNGIIMAAMMVAFRNVDNANLGKLIAMWPDLYIELQDRSNDPDGLLPEEKEPNEVNLGIEELAKKWGYDPIRRYENRAGFSRISPRQKYYIKLLAVDRKTDYEELSTIFKGYWGVDNIDDWTKADGMFAIGRLVSTEPTEEMLVSNWFSRIRQQRDVGIEEWEETWLSSLYGDLVNGEVVTIWVQNNIPKSTLIGNKVIPGVYLWFEFMPEDNAHLPLYIGESDNIFVRLYSHCWSSGSIVRQRISEYTWIVIIPTIDNIDKRGLETKYIKKFKPELNKAGIPMGSQVEDIGVPIYNRLSVDNPA